MANVMADAPQIYARHFTATELREMLAFYRTRPDRNPCRSCRKC